MTRVVSRELRRNAAGFLGSLYNSLAGQAPAYSVASGAALIMGSAFAAAPLAMLLTLLGVLAIVYSIFVMTRRYPHAASFYAYVTNTLNSRVGFFNGIIYTVFYSNNRCWLCGHSFRIPRCGGYIRSHRVPHKPIIPTPLYLLSIPIVLALVPAVLGIRPSIRTEASLTSIEIAILLLFIALSFAANMSKLSPLPFTLQGTYQTSPGGVLMALSGGLVFAISRLVHRFPRRLGIPGRMYPRARCGPRYSWGYYTYS